MNCSSIIAKINENCHRIEVRRSLIDRKEIYHLFYYGKNRLVYLDRNPLYKLITKSSFEFIDRYRNLLKDEEFKQFHNILNQTELIRIIYPYDVIE